jgi:predicted nucleic acid-binding protein
MRKTKIYLDTSVISFYFAEDSPEKMAITRKFFDQEMTTGNYEIYLSYIVFEELGDTKDPELRDKMLKFARELHAEVVPFSETVDQIATQFVEEGLIPVKYKEDGLHLAIALLHNLDYVISWNFKHLVKLKTKQALKIMAVQEGFKEVEILTPQEVIPDED